MAGELWASGIHEARILATLVDVPEEVTPEQMETWVLDFCSWDLCDQCCSNLFDRTPYAFRKAVEWSRRAGTAAIFLAGSLLLRPVSVSGNPRTLPTR